VAVTRALRTYRARHDRSENATLAKLMQQGVALTGRNTTGPPRAAPW